MNFVDIDSPGRTTDLEQGHEWLSEQGREPGEWPEPNVRPPLLVKVTLCRVLYTTVVCGFGTWKAVAAYEGNAILSNTLDVFIGIILAVLLYWLGLFETVNPPVLTWFFHEDYAVILNSLFTSRASSHQSVEMRALHVPAPTAFAFIQDSDDVSESQMTEQDISASELVRLLPMGSSITTQLEIRMEEVRRTPGSPDNPTSSSNRPSESTLTHRTQGKAIKALRSASTPTGSEFPDLATLRYIVRSPIAFWDRDAYFTDHVVAQNKMDLFFPLDGAPLSTRELLNSPEKFVIPAPPKGPARWIFGCRTPVGLVPTYWDNEDGLKHLRDAGVNLDPSAAIGHMRYRTGIRTLQFVVRKGGVLSEKEFKRKYLLIVQDTKSLASEPNLTVPQMEEFVKLSGQPLTALKWYWARPPKH